MSSQTYSMAVSMHARLLLQPKNITDVQEPYDLYCARSQEIRGKNKTCSQISNDVSNASWHNLSSIILSFPFFCQHAVTGFLKKIHSKSTALPTKDHKTKQKKFRYQSLQLVYNGPFLYIYIYINLF